MGEQRLVGRPGAPGGSVQKVLAAIHDPVRLEVVRRLYNAGTPLQCAALYDGINKSTATHHFKILREAGITERMVIDGLTFQRLRLDEVDAAMPGLLASVVAAPTGTPPLAERRQGHTVAREPLANRPRDLHGAGRVTVHADRFDGDRYRGAVHRGDPPVGDHRHHPRGDLVDVVQHRVAFAARHQLPVGPVGAVGERFGHGTQTQSLCSGEEHRAGQPEHRQPGVDRVHGLGDGVRLVSVVTIELYSAPWGLT